MQSFAIIGTFFPALGIDLDHAMSRLTQIDMNLAVFAIDFLLAAGLALPNHVHAVLDAASLVPWLSCNFAAKFDQIFRSRCQATVSYQGDRCGKILANGKSLG